MINACAIMVAYFACASYKIYYWLPARTFKLTGFLRGNTLPIRHTTTAPQRTQFHGWVHEARWRRFFFSSGGASSEATFRPGGGHFGSRLAPPFKRQTVALGATTSRYMLDLVVRAPRLKI